MLRLITLTDGRNRRIHLLTNVQDESQLDEKTAGEFYTMRWDIELYYRALKQTLDRRKLASTSPTNARMELNWAMMGLWLLCLMGVSAIGQAGKDVLRLSVASMLRTIRRVMATPNSRAGSAGVGREFARATQDSYVRTKRKKARNWAHKKKPKPIGAPRARNATRLEVKQAAEIRAKRLAA